MRRVFVVLGLVLGTAAGAAELPVVDWSAYPLGTHGIPAGWAPQSWSRSTYDLTIVEDEGHRALRMRARDERATITLPLGGRVRLQATPVLEWQWKALVLPPGDARRKETSDQVAQIYVIWPRPPEALRSRIIGYVWDTTAPAGSTFQSRKTGTVMYIVVRSGADAVGRWLTERRDVGADFRRLYGEEPVDPGALALSVDANDTHTEAESLVGRIVFRSGPP
jgi:hypothetical protein